MFSVAEKICASELAITYAVKIPPFTRKVMEYPPPLYQKILSNKAEIKRNIAGESRLFNFDSPNYINKKDKERITQFD